MPATTRSSTRSYRTAATAIHAAGTNPVYMVTAAPGQGQNAFYNELKSALAGAPNNNKKWLVKDEQMLIRLCRRTEMTPELMAASLGRTEEAIRYRLSKIIHEHLDGRTDNASIKEVSDWLLPN